MHFPERESLDRLATAHLAEAWRFATRLTNDSDWAEEIVAEALLRATAAWHEFRREAQFRTWFFRIVINVFRDQYRRRRPSEPLDIEPVDPHASEPAAEASAAELGRLVAARVSALPPRQREVLVLVSYEGLTPPEVAELLGIAVQNVYTTLHAARQRLRQQLAAYWTEK